jgi:formate dehydrogenase iron-sulfur subunit
MTASNDRNVSRRTFLKGAGGLSAAWLVGGAVSPVYASVGSSEGGWGVLVDLTRCNGCESCVLACKRSNGLPNPESVPEHLDSDAYTYLEERLVRLPDQEIRTAFVKRQCMHCLEPACVSACTVGALHKRPDGPVVYEADKCIGCRYCQYACPFGVPTYEWENPLGLIAKCQFCFERLGEGREPACTEACPEGALRFGRRDALLNQAHAQIATNPGRYVDHVYGEQEAGGTSMLYLASMSFELLGFPSLGAEAIPHNAETIMKGTPLVAVTVASVVTGLHWVLKRRDEKLAQVRASADEVGEGK